MCSDPGYSTQDDWSSYLTHIFIVGKGHLLGRSASNAGGRAFESGSTSSSNSAFGQTISVDRNAVTITSISGSTCKYVIWYY